MTKIVMMAVVGMMLMGCMADDDQEAISSSEMALTSEGEAPTSDMTRQWCEGECWANWENLLAICNLLPNAPVYGNPPRANHDWTSEGWDNWNQCNEDANNAHDRCDLICQLKTPGKPRGGGGDLCLPQLPGCSI